MTETSNNQGSQPAMIPLSVPHLTGNEWKYVKNCLDTNWVSSVGSYVDEFEDRVAKYVGNRYAVATMNGTSALHTALLVAGVEPDDEVLVSTLTFVASVNAIRYAGAHPVLVDAESRYWQIDPNLIEQFLVQKCEYREGQLFNRISGRRVKAIMPVHIMGHSVDLKAIREIAQKFNLVIVEDAAEALGTEYDGQRVGGGTDCEIACFSFNGNKIITTGGGGMIVTSRADWAERAKYLTTTAKDDPVEYIHGEVGFNYRMTNMLAAMGVAQMELLPAFVDMKRGIARNYRKQLQNVPGVYVFQEAKNTSSTYWMSTVEIDPTIAGIDARTVMEKLAEQRIQSRPFWQPMHMSPANQDCETVLSGTAERLYSRCLSLPSSVNLTAEDQRRVSETIEAICQQNTAGMSATAKSAA